jgi:hypothetical protein
MSDMKEIHKTIFNNPSSVATTIDIEYRSGAVRTSFHQAAVITHSMNKDAAFHYVFLTNCTHQSSHSSTSQALANCRSCTRAAIFFHENMCSQSCNIKHYIFSNTVASLNWKAK